VTDTTRSFRLSAVRFWLWAALLYLAFLAVVGLLLRWTGQVFDPIAVATMTLGLTIILVVLGLRYRAVVSAEGLGFTDFEGAWRFVRWDQIEWADRVRALGLPTLEMRITGLEGREGLLLLLGDLDGFRAAVAKAAGPSHPVTWALLKADDRGRPSQATRS
jgi:hypothetical protein